MSRPKEFLAWARATFGPVALLRSERMMRFAEAQREWERVQAIPQAEWARRHQAKVEIGIAS